MSAQPRTTDRAPAFAPCPAEEATVRIGGSFALPAVLILGARRNRYRKDGAIQAPST